MPGHSSAKREFLNWVSSLDSTQISTREKQLLNLLIDHFDEISELGTAGGKRALRLGKLIMEKGELQPSEMPAIGEEPVDPEEKIISLVEMKIGPFRGFKTQESLTFDRPYTFMYGPNGSGKSSFCEGLEFALLGGIEEAEAKRIPIDNYIKNEQAARGVRPELKVKIANGEIKPLSHGNSAYRFSFIEKNRIDAFARISATTARDQLNRISTLFGLDQFSEFVNGFTDDFDYRYLNLANTKKLEFIKEEQEVEAAKSRLQVVSTDIEAIPAKIKTIVDELGVDGLTDMASVRVFLSGEDGTCGVIGQLLEQKAESIPNDLDASVLDSIRALHTQLSDDLFSLDSNLVSLGKVATKLNYKDLFSAIESIAEDDASDKSQCPACQTPLETVTVNPYDFAKEELLKMKELTALQSDVKATAEQICTCVRSLNGEIELVDTIRICLDGPETTQDTFTEIALSEILSFEAWEPILVAEMKIFNDVMMTFPDLTEQIKQYDKLLEDKRIKQASINSDLQIYQGHKGQLDGILAQQELLLDEKAKIKKTLELFDSQNADRITEIETAQVIVDQNYAFKNAYDSLILKLKSWRNHLPALLSAGLSANTMRFYNIINGHDPDFERLESLILPNTAGEKIELKFCGDENNYDALQILSDGHIKALGLSLLLAKVVADDLGFVIYDDIVNAIDDDHRDGIASLLLGAPELKDRQQIITCHGEQFINKLSHKLGASATSKLVTNYRFTPADCIEERGVTVSIGDSKHYLISAQKSFEENSLKSCLASCRRAIESISERLWKKLSKNSIANLSVIMRQPGGRPDLYSVVYALIIALKKIKFSDESKLQVNFELLIKKYNWALVNKGTHEQGDLPEFEREDAAHLLALVGAIEQEVLALKLEVGQKPTA